MVDSDTLRHSMNAYVNALNTEAVGPLAIAILERIVDYYGPNPGQYGPNQSRVRPSPMDALLLVIATLHEPDPALVSDADFLGLSHVARDKLFSLLRGARDYTGVMGITPLENICKAFRGESPILE